MSYRVRRGFRGMGVLDYYDLMAQAHLENCSPMDSTCVSNNVAKQAAVEDYWAAHQSTGVPDSTVLTFTPQTEAQVRENYNPANIFSGGNVIDTRGIMQVSGDMGVAPGGSYLGGGVAPVSVAVAAPAAAAPKTAAGQTIINSAGVVQPPGIGPAVSIGGFDLSSVPWWGWAVAGGAALSFAFGGGRGRG